VIQDTITPTAVDPPTWLATTPPTAHSARSASLTNGRRLAAASIGASLYPFIAVAVSPIVGSSSVTTGLIGLAMGMVIAGLIAPARSLVEWALVAGLTFGLGVALGAIHMLMMLGVVAAM
jgi:hypothetical protein